MGHPKGLMDYHGSPWLEYQLSCLAQCKLGQVVVVLGEDHELYGAQLPYLKSAVKDWSQFQGLNLRVQHNLKADSGPFASLQCGLKPLSGDRLHHHCYVLPIDVPCPSPNLWLMLKDHLNKSQAMVAIPTHLQRGGHPALLSSLFWPQLLEVNPQSPQGRLDLQIKNLPQEQMLRLPTEDNRVTMNLNTPELWREYCEQDNPLRSAEKIGKSKE